VSGGSELVYGRVGDYVYYNIQRLEVPQGFTPVGFTGDNQGYLLQTTEAKTLWLYDYTTQTSTPVIDYRGTEYSLASEIVFNQEWLVWSELGSYVRQTDGSRERSVRLLARNLLTPQEDWEVAVSVSSPTHASALPFDSLSLDGYTLVYRLSLFNAGRRDTKVMLTQLNSRANWTMATASANGGRLIGRCSVADQVVTWDVQANYQLVSNVVPPLPRGAYSLYMYQLDGSKLERGENPETRLSLNGSIYAPVAHGGSIFALQARGGEIVIIEINSALKTGSSRVFGYSLSPYIYETYHDPDYLRQPKERYVQRSHIQVGQRLLTWESSIRDKQYVYDLASYVLVELPINFGSNFLEYPEEYPEHMWKQAIPGLDADYLWIGSTNYQGNSYILRIE